MSESVPIGDELGEGGELKAGGDGVVEGDGDDDAMQASAPSVRVRLLAISAHPSVAFIVTLNHRLPP